MGLITAYNLRSMLARKATAAMTLMGIAMVVAVFVMTLALAQGFRATLVSSGSPQNAIVLRKGATAETVSAVLRPQLPLIESLQQVARGADGQALASPELVVIISLPRLSDLQPANVPVRGVGPKAFQVRDTLKMAEGRRFTPGTREINVGRLASRRFGGLTLDSDVRFGGAAWRVVGIFTAGDASFESEVWGDIDLMMPAFQRNGYQSVTVKLTDPSAFEPLESVIAGDPRLDLRPRREQEYYEGQAETLTTVIRVFGTFVTAFLAESVALALVGGVVGCLLALPVHGLSTGTTNFASFSEVAFKFRITPALLAGGLVFAALMGAAGGLLPALRAARIPIARALREI